MTGKLSTFGAFAGGGNGNVFNAAHALASLFMTITGDSFDDASTLEAQQQARP
jgi:hypothetical protein